MAKQVKLKQSADQCGVGRAVRKLQPRKLFQQSFTEESQTTSPAGRRPGHQAMMSPPRKTSLVTQNRGRKTNRAAFVTYVQHSPVRGEMVHFDFPSIFLDETHPCGSPSRTDWHSFGRSPFGGLLEQILRR